MNFRNISAWSIRNPVTPLVLFAALVLAGVVSFMRMDVNQNPDVSFPMVSVTVVQPGAAPTELETQVTAAPCSDDIRMRRRELPSVRPKPRSSGWATMVALR